LPVAIAEADDGHDERVGDGDTKAEIRPALPQFGLQAALAASADRWPARYCEGALRIDERLKCVHVVNVGLELEHGIAAHVRADGQARVC
jgi:hypothetical protein